MRKICLAIATLLAVWPGPMLRAQSAALTGEILATSYPSIQEALDKNPGKMICLPAGRYEISRAIEIKTDNAGLYGMGTIVQTNPADDIIRIEGRKNVQLLDLTLTRPEGKMDTDKSALRVEACEQVVADGLQVLENRTQYHAIHFGSCKKSRITNCLVQNYMSPGSSDRTKGEDWGYAFNVINGAGISTRGCEGQLIQGNRVIELNLVPTRELKEKYKLGDFTKMNPVKGRLLPQYMWDAKYNNAWHQGSAIEVRFPKAGPDGKTDYSASNYTRVIGNYIHNAAQGMDIHGDHVVIANNIVNDAFMGMKTMHGSRNVIITGNQFGKVALWGIYVSPGNFGFEATAATATEPAHEANAQAGTIMANNIISDFGYGNSGWIWADEKALPLCGILIDKGQRPEIWPAKDILITGNVMYDPGRDGVMQNGKVVVPPPRYQYAISVQTAPGGPKDVRISKNILHPGTKGVANIPLQD